MLYRAMNKLEKLQKERPPPSTRPNVAQAASLSSIGGDVERVSDLQCRHSWRH
jgi:hypothetical protein